MGGKENDNDNYEQLSNEELDRLLREKLPDMALFPVTNETRNTAIAILRILPTKGQQ